MGKTQLKPPTPLGGKAAKVSTREAPDWLSRAASPASAAESLISDGAVDRPG